jgi:hypothetical protein
LIFFFLVVRENLLLTFRIFEKTELFMGVEINIINNTCMAL